MNDAPRALPPAPDPLPVPVVDNHTHLDHVRGADGPPDDAQVAALLARAREVGVTRVVQIGCELPAARWTAAVVERFDAVLGGVGLHPTEAAAIVAAQPDPAAGQVALAAAVEEIESLARHPRIGVVGETGLDYHWVQDEAGRAAQADSFRRHIDLAKRLGKVLQIHDRDAHDDVLAVLESEGAPERTVFHCFSGDAAMARHCAERGWYLSFAGTVTFKNAAGLREALAAVPRERVLVETDAPYLTPMPHRGRPNASYLMPWTVRTMAEVTRTALDEMCITLAGNSQRLYGY